MKCHCPWGPKIESLLLLNPWEWKVFWSDHLRRRNAKQKLLLSYMSLVNKKLRTMIQQPFSTLLKSTPNSLVTEFFSCSWLYNFFFFFNFTILYWFGHISTWIHHRYTRVPHPEPSSLLPPRTGEQCGDSLKNWKFLKRWEYHHLTCLLRNLYAGQEATVITRHGTTDWFQIGKGVCQGSILSPCFI